jgi:hypothetical protein
VLSATDGLALGQIGPLCVALWRGAVTRERFDRQAAALAQVVASHPGYAGFMCIVEPGASPPNQELRRASAEMIESHGDRLAFVVPVIEGSGLQAGIAHGVLTTISLLVSRRKTRLVYFASVAAAVSWSRERATLPESVEVIGFVEDLRAKLG